MCCTSSPNPESRIPPPFTARVVRGAGRGKALGSPTLNLDLRDVPADLQEGIYACHAAIDQNALPRPAVLFFGPRLFYDASHSCEVHMLDAEIPSPPKRISVQPIAWIRPVEDFPDEAALQRRIASDIAASRAILAVHDDPRTHQESGS